MSCCAQVEFTPLQVGWGSGLLFSPGAKISSPIPDALEQQRLSGIGFGHWRNYLSNELSSGLVQLHHQARQFHYSAQFYRSGYEVSRKISGNVHVSRGLSDQWSLGVGAGIVQENLGETVARFYPGAGISSIYRLSNIRIGSYLQYADGFTGILGFHVPLSSKAACYIENRMDENTSRWHGGLSYTIDSVFIATVGYQSLPSRPSMGIAWLTRRLTISVAGEFHPKLGFHPCAFLIIHLNMEEKRL